MRLTFSCEKILKIGVNELEVLGHLSQLVKDVKSLQVRSIFLFCSWGEQISKDQNWFVRLQG